MTEKFGYESQNDVTIKKIDSSQNLQRKNSVGEQKEGDPIKNLHVLGSKITTVCEEIYKVHGNKEVTKSGTTYSVSKEGTSWTLNTKTSDGEHTLRYSYSWDSVQKVFILGSGWDEDYTSIQDKDFNEYMSAIDRASKALLGRIIPIDPSKVNIEQANYTKESVFDAEFISSGTNDFITENNFTQQELSYFHALKIKGYKMNYYLGKSGYQVIELNTPWLDDGNALVELNFTYPRGKLVGEVISRINIFLDKQYITYNDTAVGQLLDEGFIDPVNFFQNSEYKDFFDYLHTTFDMTSPSGEKLISKDNKDNFKRLIIAYFEDLKEKSPADEIIKKYTIRPQFKQGRNLDNLELVPDQYNDGKKYFEAKDLLINPSGMPEGFEVNHLNQ